MLSLVNRAVLNTKQCVTASCTRALSDVGSTKPHVTYDKEIRQVAARVCGNHIQKPLSQRNHSLLNKYLKAPRAVQPHQVNWVTDVRKLTDLTREMRHMTLFTDGYMDFRDTVAKVRKSKQKRTKDEMAQAAIDKFKAHYKKRRADIKAEYEASLKPVEVVKATGGVRYGDTSKDVFKVEAKKFKKHTEFNGQIKLDNYYLNPKSKKHQFDKNVAYKDVMGIPRNKPVTRQINTPTGSIQKNIWIKKDNIPRIGWNATMKDIHWYENPNPKPGRSPAPRLFLSQVDGMKTLKPKKPKKAKQLRGYRGKRTKKEELPLDEVSYNLIPAIIKE